MFGLFRTVLDDAYLCLMALAILCAPACLFAKTSQSPSQGHEDHSRCRDLYQGVSDEPMREALDPDAVKSGRLKICGASPGCSSCKEMRPGDCSYVFPSNVFVYPSKKKGVEEICACTVFACSLPWDPAGWNKKCMKELGCYEKPRYGGIGEFPDALCSGDRGNYVKFGPMAFSLQSYYSPGVWAYEYKKDALVSSKPVFPVASYEYLREHGRVEGMITTSSAPTTVPKGQNVLHLSNGGQNHYFAYVWSDSICIRDFGKDPSLDRKFVESCLPIPGQDPPLLYSVEAGSGIVQGLLKKRYQAARMLAHDARTSVRLGHGEIMERVEAAAPHAQRIGLRTGYDKECCTEESKELLDRAVILPCNVEYGCEKTNGVAPHFFKVSQIGQRERPVAATGISAFKGFPVRAAQRRAQGVLDSTSLQAEGMCRFANAHPEVPIGSNGSSASSVTQGAALQSCGYREGRVKNECTYGSCPENLGYVACTVENVIGGDREFEVLHGTKCEKRDIPSPSVGEGEKPCYERVRVKKKPKMLRRYILVESGGVQKRVRCDDKHDIDLRTLGQDVLSKAEVTGNRFKFSSEYIGRVADGVVGTDPCVSSDYDIAYFYEDGGFLTGVDLTQCGTPVVEYFAPGRIISGCEYDYVRADNYKPYLSSVPGTGSNVSIVPLSMYEQGRCVDNFRSMWFVPSYNSGGGASTGVSDAFFCKWDECQVIISDSERVSAESDSSGSNKIQVRTVYRYPVVDFKTSGYTDNPKDADFLFGRNQGCSLYRVEMWGGGQAAVTDESRSVKRSGRPGQYAMLVLDFKKLQDDLAVLRDYQQEASLLSPPNASVQNIAGSRYSLVIKIGEGGLVGGENKNGGPTKLQLCVAQDSIRQKIANSEQCYSIASVVGGGSNSIGSAPYTNSFVVYYRTITGDVLERDVGSHSLLENHNAMFTKFSLTMNLKAAEKKESPLKEASERMKKILENRSYFDGRSAPSQFCSYKSKRSEAVDIFVPGMGGCWSNLSGGKPTEQSKPGVGENGAVMITCERWGDAASSSPKSVKK